MTLEPILHWVACHPLNPIRYLEWLHKSTIELNIDTYEVVHQLVKMTVLNEDALLCLKQRVNVRFVSKLRYVSQDLILKCTI